MISSNPTEKIFCRYTNYTSQFQIIRISNIPHWFFERAIVPKGSILFEAFHEGKLEVHTSTMMGAILSDVIPCNQLSQPQDISRRELPFIQKTA
jgi:hypothetical protein